MTGDDDDFLPRLGKMRAGGSRQGRKFLQQVIAATMLAGGGKSGAGKSRYGGGRTARGAGAGRVLASRDRFAAFRQRRVIVKSRIVRLAGKGIGGARAHLRYIQRDGVTRDGTPGELYDATHNRADGKEFLERSVGDRHQFRFIVSAEDGDQYDDLKPLIRRLMARMETDLDTRLEWVAVDHFNTGHPHSHVIVRGKDERGADLVIARDYLAAGLRERAVEIVSLDLGPRTDVEIEDRLRREVEQERLTSLDRRLLRDVDADGLVGSTERDPFRQALRAGRLQKLKRLGLAEEIRPGRWRLADGLEETLRRMGERGDIIKTLHRAMTEQGLVRASGDMVIDGPNSLSARPLVGRVVTRGLSDEAADRHYLIVDGADGRVHYVDIGKGEAVEPIPEGAVVRLEPQRGNSAPVAVRMLSPLPLHRQLASGGPTWLDHELIAELPEPLRDAGFGHEVREAQSRRRQWLIAEGLAEEEQDRIVYRANLLAVMRRREMTRVAGQLSDELGLAYVEQHPGQRIAGTFRRIVEVSAEKMAVIEKSKEFTLVPWRPSLDRHLGKPVSGIMRGDDVVWTMGRQRGGPGVS